MDSKAKLDYVAGQVEGRYKPAPTPSTVDKKWSQEDKAKFEQGTADYTQDPIIKFFKSKFSR